MLETVSSPQARLDALRAAEPRLDPLRLHYLEQLAQRSVAAPEAVRLILQSKLEAALTELEQGLVKAADLADGHEREQPAPLKNTVTPLLELSQYLQRAKQAASHQQVPNHFGDKLVSDSEANGEMASVQRFRQTWSRLAAEEEVSKASQRGPDQAGPLNSHRLVLRSLELLRDLSPHYLQRFLSQVQTLQWLESASEGLTAVKPKPARHSRVMK
jgi:hypothetical protein